ncbi:MAG: hypothetical protein HOA19_05025 [Candidatus Marinimicrobia bacterium]|nr:hypothetical protein [Candidatus Neomarinimicrobiota bacterium]MBT6866692.1 hypothetical protein [Candidatus Neomarinimicrobiota bacterium]
MEKLKQFLSVLIFLGMCHGQSYTISILGVQAAHVVQTIHDSGRIEFTTQNRGIFELIWPTKNIYEATFEPNTFTLISWGKKIKQGDFKQTISAEVDSSGLLIYDEKNKIKIEESTTTILTALAMVQKKLPAELDTKWFSYEHQGNLGKLRFIWADSSNAWNGKDSILCDHYRLDIELENPLEIKSENSDYFLDEINGNDVIRELWLSRSVPKRIIQAHLKTAWFPVSATINE